MPDSWTWTRRGIALLAVDGHPALALRAGAEIAANVMLAEVRADHVLINRSGAVQEIRLPAKPAPEGIVKVRQHPRASPVCQRNRGLLSVRAIAGNHAQVMSTFVTLVVPTVPVPFATVQVLFPVDDVAVT